MPNLTVYAGCYTPGGPGEGLLAFSMNAATGVLNPIGSTTAANPSFLQLAGGRLYAACEEAYTGRVCAFTLENPAMPDTLGCADAPGGATCHLAVWPDCTHVTLANYASGNLFTVRLAEGKPCEVTQSIQLFGTGPNRARQEGPHAHAVYFAPHSPCLVACDLGSDKLLVYTTAPDGHLTPNAGGHTVQLHPGSGPRHIAFHPNGRWAYVVCELSCEVVVFDFHAATGIFSQKQVASTVSGPKNGSTAAEAAISPDGKFLYVSTRGEDSIAVWAIDETTGTITAVGSYACGGRGPRHFSLTPDGRFVVVANENSGDIAVITRSAETGALETVVDVAEAPHVVCAILREEADA